MRSKHHNKATKPEQSIIIAHPGPTADSMDVTGDDDGAKDSDVPFNFATNMEASVHDT